jgi:hypothetical protein
MGRGISLRAKGILMTDRDSLPARILLWVVMSGVVATDLHQCQTQFPWPYPPFSRLLTRRSGLQDAALIATGFRALAADIAWVQLLQYVGGGTLPGEDVNRTYDELLPMTLRVTRIDPYFRHAYLYSAGMLAFFKNIQRPQEALIVLNEGIQANPDYWPLRTYAAAIGFMEKDQFDAMAQMLEKTVTDPQCPPMIKSIMANAYKLHGRTRDALRIWEMLLNDPRGPEYHDKARREIRAILRGEGR